jgi:hypothetical protein
MELTLRRKVQDLVLADQRSLGNLMRMALTRWLDEHDEQQTRSVA